VASSVIGQIIIVQAENKKLTICYCFVFSTIFQFQCIPKERLFIAFFIVFTAAEYSFSTSIHFLILVKPRYSATLTQRPWSRWAEIPYYTVFRLPAILRTLPHSIYRHKLQRRSRDWCYAVCVYCILLSCNAVEGDAAQNGYLWSVTQAVVRVFHCNSFPIVMHAYFFLRSIESLS